MASSTLYQVSNTSKATSIRKSAWICSSKAIDRSKRMRTSLFLCLVLITLIAIYVIDAAAARRPNQVNRRSAAPASRPSSRNAAEGAGGVARRPDYDNDDDDDEGDADDGEEEIYRRRKARRILQTENDDEEDDEEDEDEPWPRRSPSVRGKGELNRKGGRRRGSSGIGSKSIQTASSGAVGFAKASRFWGTTNMFGLGERGRAVLREFKAALSSELEGEIVKATRPDDKQIKLKHLEPLVAITYQTPAQLDPFPPVMRKLWAKMREGDWRTSIKAIYLLHRFAANGAPEQSANFQNRLAELSRQTDSRSKRHYFDVSAMASEGRPLVPIYAAYVLYRALHFGPGFPEIARLVQVIPPPTAKNGVNIEAAGGGRGVVDEREHHALFEKTEAMIERALAVRLGPDDDITELTSACIEAIYFDIQQVLDSLADHLTTSARTVSTEEEVQRLRRCIPLYETAVEGLNDYVSRHRSLVESHGVTLVPMNPVTIGPTPSVPSIEEVDLSETDALLLDDEGEVEGSAATPSQKASRSQGASTSSSSSKVGEEEVEEEEPPVRPVLRRSNAVVEDDEEEEKEGECEAPSTPIRKRIVSKPTSPTAAATAARMKADRRRVEEDEKRIEVSPERKVKKKKSPEKKKKSPSSSSSASSPTKKAGSSGKGSSLGGERSKLRSSSSISSSRSSSNEKPLSPSSSSGTKTKKMSSSSTSSSGSSSSSKKKRRDG